MLPPLRIATALLEPDWPRPRPRCCCCGCCRHAAVGTPCERRQNGWSHAEIAFDWNRRCRISINRVWCVCRSANWTSCSVYVCSARCDNRPFSNAYSSVKIRRTMLKHLRLISCCVVRSRYFSAVHSAITWQSRRGDNRSTVNSQKSAILSNQWAIPGVNDNVIVTVWVMLSC